MARSSGITNVYRRCTDCTVVVHRDAVVAACSTSAHESRSIGIGYGRNGHDTATSDYIDYSANFDQGEGTADQSRPFRYNCPAARDSRKFHAPNKLILLSSLFAFSFVASVSRLREINLFFLFSISGFLFVPCWQKDIERPHSFIIEQGVVNG